jgi:hypothetical protein
MIHRDHLRSKSKICRTQCSDWGTDPKTGFVGCLLYLPGCMCKREDDLLAGKGCKRKTNPLFGPVDHETSKS